MKNWMNLPPSHCRPLPPRSIGAGTTHRASPKPTGLVFKKKIKLFPPPPTPEGAGGGGGDKREGAETWSAPGVGTDRGKDKKQVLCTKIH
jgi:hypothetical protein